VLEIDAASNTGVDDVRTLRENVRYLPTGGKKRIYIIDEVHRLSGAAFDALLKTLEEPPPHVIFVLATTEPLKVPETILSRTQRFDFKRVSANDLVEHLRRVAESEKLNVEEAALQVLARKADGSVRDSLSLLDQVAAFAGEKIERQNVIDALGLIDRQMLFEYTEAGAARDSKQVLLLSGRILEAGVDVADFVQELLEHFRILMVLAVDEGSTDLLRLVPDELELYARQAENFSVGDLVRMMKIVGDLNLDLKQGLDERLLLELTGIKLAQMEGTIRFEDVIQRLQELQPEAVGNDLFGRSKKKSERLTLARPSGQATESVEPVPAAARPVNMAMLKAGWEIFLGFLRQRSQMLASQLAMVELQKVSDNELHLEFGPAGTAALQLVDKTENRRVVEQALREHFRANLRVIYSINRDREAPPVPASNNFNNHIDAAKLLENSPRLRMLVEKVDGKIVGVKKLE
ncbi:MAG: DNA polymerase III subunit gamma/tau, partial [Candidatus Zixiibacteriota bacterium]